MILISLPAILGMVSMCDCEGIASSNQLISARNTWKNSREKAHINSFLQYGSRGIISKYCCERFEKLRENLISRNKLSSGGAALLVGAGYFWDKRIWLDDEFCNCLHAEVVRLNNSEAIKFDRSRLEATYVAKDEEIFSQGFSSQSNNSSQLLTTHNTMSHNFILLKSNEIAFSKIDNHEKRLRVLSYRCSCVQKRKVEHKVFSSVTKARNSSHAKIFVFFVGWK